MIIDRQRDFSLSWGEKCVRCGVGTSVKHPFCCERTRWILELFEFSRSTRGGKISGRGWRATMPSIRSNRPLTTVPRR